MNVQRQIDRLVAVQAAQWYEELENGTDRRNAEFVRWIAESPRHIEAFLSVASEARLASQVFRAGAFDPQKVLGACTPEALPLAMPPREVPERHRPRRLLSWLAAATIAAVSAGAVLYQTVLSWQRYETSVGEQRTIQLNEGSIVNLNARSRVDLRFDEAQREVHLLHGEATFKVAPDRARPFRVHTADAIVEAVGTQFNVYARPDGTTTVSVLEGKVKISRDITNLVSRSTQEMVPVAAGEEARVPAIGNIERVERPDVAEAIAWQQRKLIFKRTALEEMAAEFNRYNKATQIRLEDIEPGRFRFTGAFDADDPRSLAALLMHEPDLVVTQSADAILIRSRAASAPSPP